jgi:NAD(P)-dependent dehydrogenase (short-subunit alcohol dehydrogenase family)
VAWRVDDLARELAELRSRGAEAVEYDTPELKTENGIVDTGDALHACGSGTRARTCSGSTSQANASMSGTSGGPMRTGDRAWLITGASSGFGRAIAETALARGDSVTAASHRTDALSDLAQNERAHVVSLDVTDAVQRAAAVSETLERFGRIDVLVNNAGRTQVGAVEESSDEELRALFELHFFAPAALTRAVMPHMRERGGGAIVQMSSVGGRVTAPGFGAYCATEFALEGFTETLRDEVAGFGIHTVIVEPGALRTGLFRPGASRPRAVGSLSLLGDQEWRVRYVRDRPSRTFAPSRAAWERAPHRSPDGCSGRVPRCNEAEGGRSWVIAPAPVTDTVSDLATPV